MDSGRSQRGWLEESGCPQRYFRVNGTKSRDVLKGTLVFPEDIPVEVPLKVPKGIPVEVPLKVPEDIPVLSALLFLVNDLSIRDCILYYFIQCLRKTCGVSLDSAGKFVYFKETVTAQGMANGHFGRQERSGAMAFPEGRGDPAR